MAGDRNRANTIMINKEVWVESGETATIGGGSNVKEVERQWGSDGKLENGKVQ